MIENNEFIEMTDFIHGEFQKIFNTYGPKELPKGFLTSLSKSILKRYSLLNKNERRKLKFNITVDYAKFTMPHSFIWKWFHPRIWTRIKEDLAREKQAESDTSVLEPEEIVAPEVLPPAIGPDVQSMSYPSSLDNRQI